MVGLKRRMLVGLFAGLAFLGGLAGWQGHAITGATSSHVMHVAGDGQPIPPPSF